ncbi:peroxiredoxin-like family protein [Kitasatospora sp. NPDC057223]|uniref:peroxiredoxin-like family protein n=1 Tax=Kitasatospora sp. NPDC057223 TaxID=3346055 RepID=UPI003642CE46
MSLDAELRAFHQARQQQIPADVREVMDRAAAELAAGGRAGNALGVGGPAPDFRLPSATGRTVALADLLALGPVVLTFYRGAWCPYCNLALRALQQAHAAITALGAQLVAVSPQPPDDSLSLAEQHALAFEVLSDPGSGTAGEYGLAYDLPAELSAVHARFGAGGTELPRTLPLAATYVIDRDGTVRWAFVDSDFTRRAEPSDILAALAALAGAPVPAT